MDIQKSDNKKTQPPIEYIIMEKWKKIWDPPKETTIKRLIDRFKYQTEFNNRKIKGEYPDAISLDIIKNEIGISNFPKKVPSWIEVDKKGNETHHAGRKIDPSKEFKEIFDDSKIGLMFRKYYKNRFKSVITRNFFFISLFLLIANFFYLFSIWGFKWSPYADYFESNPLILLYLGIPTIYTLITVVIFMNELLTKVRPSKWYWLSVILISLFPSLYYLFELSTNLSLLNFFVIDFVPINLRELLIIYSVYNSFIILILAVSSIGNSIIPCTSKGQLLYSFLKLEFTFRSQSISNIKLAPKYFHMALISLNELLMKYFDLAIKNLNDIESSFNANLIKEGVDFLVENLAFSNDDKLLGYFSKGILINKKEKSSRKFLNKKDRKKRREEDYINNLLSLNDVINKIQSISKEMSFIRITLKERIHYKSQKIISILFALLSFILGNVLPLFL